MNIKKLFCVLFITVMLLSVPCAYALDSDTNDDVNEVQNDVKLSSSENEIEQVDNPMDKKVDSNKNSVNSPSSSVKMNKFAEISINLGAAAVDDIKVQNNPQNIKNAIKTENTPSKNEAGNKISETKSKLSELKKLMNNCINKKKLAPGDLNPYFNRLKVADHYMELADEKFREDDYVRAINFVMSADKVMFEVYGNILLINAEIDSIKG